MTQTKSGEAFFVPSTAYQSSGAGLFDWSRSFGPAPASFFFTFKVSRKFYKLYGTKPVLYFSRENIKIYLQYICVFDTLR